MPQNITVSRRDFMRMGALGTAALGAGVRPGAATARTVPPSERITLGFIGVGARAHQLIEALRAFPEAEIVAVCDAYKGRISRAIARTGGRAQAFDDYREIIERSDIDAVVISTPDHWHYRHSVDALNAGKHSYIEKPLTYSIDEGLGIIEAQSKSGGVVQVGSPGPSGILAQQARQMIEAGKIGQVTMVRAAMNRNTASGAWIYPIPPDASPETVDWELFLGPAPRRPYSPERFFRWRCYQDYSGGMSTDLYVHTCTTINYVMGAPMPESAIAMGGLYRWKHSRDVPDTINASLKYPEGFLVSLSGTFSNQGGAAGGIRFLGTEGTLILGSTLTFIPEHVNEGNGWIVDSWPEDLARAYYEDPEIRAAEMPRSRDARALEPREIYQAEGESDIMAHIREFLYAVREGTKTREDATAGHYAASCAHMINIALDRQAVVRWDADKATLAAG